MKNRYVLLLDLPLIAIAAFGAFASRFDWLFYRDHPEFLLHLFAALAIKPVAFFLTGMYKRYWRYASIQELLLIVIAVSVSSIALAVAIQIGIAFGGIGGGFSRVVFVTDWLFTLLLTGGLRFSIRIINEPNMAFRGRRRTDPPTRVLIVGAGDAGTMVAREMRRNPQLNMQPVGFLDDDLVKVGKRIAGVDVLGHSPALPEIVAAHYIDSVIIAMPTAPGRAVRAIVEMCNQTGVKSQTIPGIFELLDRQVSINRLRNVEIEDLLRRSPVAGDASAASFVTGKTVLVTGAGGSIGSELSRQIANVSPARMVLLGHGENSIFDVHARLAAAFPHVPLSTVIADIRDQGRLAAIFDRFKPQIVFHAAAHKHVPLMQENPEEAVTNNILGTRNVVNQSVRAQTERLVLISTDKAVSPTSIMGATKRVAEAIVRQAAVKNGRAFVAVRFGNVLGSRGSVVNTFKQQIELGGPVTVTHPDMTRYFMTIPEAVHLVLQASGKGKGGELFVLDMGAPVKIVDLARDLIKLSGLSEQDVPIVFTGIRPGEKMEEILFDPGMQTQPTSHPDVLQVTGPDSCHGMELDRLVSRLEDAAARADRAAIDSLLGQIILGYDPSGTALSTGVVETHRPAVH